jgi:hypothetical protein
MTRLSEQNFKPQKIIRRSSRKISRNNISVLQTILLQFFRIAKIIQITFLFYKRNFITGF